MQAAQFRNHLVKSTYKLIMMDVPTTVTKDPMFTLSLSRALNLTQYMIGLVEKVDLIIAQHGTECSNSSQLKMCGVS